jgi:hypothetical protein
MALHIKALNNDTTFLLTFIPSICPRDQKFPDAFPGAFTILIDPVSSPKSSNHDLEVKPFGASPSWSGAVMQDIPTDADLLLISQPASDHCDETSLCQLSPHIQSMIVAEPAAAKKIKRWRHFDHGNVEALRRYKRGRDDTLFRVEIPPPSPLGAAGEVTIALLAAKPDFSGGLKNAVGITYREPSSILSRSRAMVGTPPASRASDTNLKPMMSSIGSVITSTTTKSDLLGGNLEPTISALYSPHGISYDVIEPWVSSHLASEGALPLLAMIHGTTVVDTPWYVHGNMATGCPGGLEISRNLLPTVWIAAHDVESTNGGAPIKSACRTEYDIMEVQTKLWEELLEKGVRRKPQILRLDAGETFRVDVISANKVVEEVTQEVKEEEAVSNTPGDEVHEPA